MRTLVRRVLGTAALLALTACAHAAGPGAPGAPRPNRDLLTAEQIRDTRYTNLYEVVQALRGNWMNDRGVDTITRTPSVVLVYLDDTKLGGVEMLKTITPAQVEYIRHYDGVAAAGRWGLDHGKGVIYVSTHPLQQ